MTIRVRLTLWYVAVLAVTLSLLGLLVYGALSRVVSAEIDDSLRLRAEDTARVIRIRGDLSFPRRMPSTGAALPSSTFTRRRACRFRSKPASRTATPDPFR